MNKKIKNTSDFIKAILIIKNNILLILGVVFASSILSVYLSLQMPNMYRSEVKIVPSSDDSQKGIGALASQFGGLASLSGINLGGKSDVNLLIDTINSRSFLKPFIEKNNIIVKLFSTKSWDAKSDKLSIDSDIYNPKTKKWLRDVEFPKIPKPSLEEAYEEFKKIFSVHLNKKTNLITLSITFYSPKIAKNWLDLLTNDLSHYLRKKDQNKADESIKFLTNEHSTSHIVAIQTVLSDILKEQYQKKMLTEIRKNYGFEIRDNSYLPESKYSPKRVFIVLGATVGSFVLAVIFIFLRIFWRELSLA